MDGHHDYEQFVSTQRARLFRTAVMITKDRHLADDLLQTALLALFLHWHDVRDPAATGAYVRQTMVRTYASWCRRSSWHERPVGLDVDASSAWCLDEARVDLVAALAGLSARQRTVLVLRFVEDRSVADTAARLGVTAGTVKQHTSRALHALRQIIDGPAGSERHLAPAGAGGPRAA